jgi:hypothetical protein
MEEEEFGITKMVKGAMSDLMNQSKKLEIATLNIQIKFQYKGYEIAVLGKNPETLVSAVNELQDKHLKKLRAKIKEVEK